MNLGKKVLDLCLGNYSVCLYDVLPNFKDMLTFACAALDGAGNCFLTTRPKVSACGPVMPVTYNVPMCLCIFLPEHTYNAYLESIFPFWISREPVSWPWCNLAASQRRPYCASVNGHSPVGLVSWQWDTVDWAYVLCDSRSQITSLSTVILALGKTRSRREPNVGCRGPDRPGWCGALPKKVSTRAVELAGALLWWSWPARSVIVNVQYGLLWLAAK